MSAGKLAAVVGVIGCAAVAYTWRTSRESHTVFEPVIPRIESGIQCPWRDAETDLTNWFAGATRFVVQDVVLSGKRLQLQERLGRPVRPEEMALHCYPVLSNEVQIGAVLTRRLKGEHGAIELALALGPDRRIQHFKVQRIREPTEVVVGLSNCDLEGQLQNKSFEDEIVFNCARLSPGAKVLSDNLANEVKALLILYDLGYTELSRSHH
jgi:hypothetical protein